MRNGIIPVITEDMPIDTAIEYTILQGISTHYNPLATLTCVLQTIIIRRALLDASSRNGAPQIPPPTMNDIRSMIDNEWHTWLSRVTEPACLEWIRTVGKTEIKMAEVQLLEELNGFETFDPYGYMYKGVSGYSVLSLKIALWALHWSVKREKVLVAPDHLPTWPFDNQPSGFDSIMFVVLIGADADTYGAIAGPMLAAYHPFIKESFMDKLWERNTVESIQF
jgi:ADP-ribosylglycohydrolase